MLNWIGTSAAKAFCGAAMFMDESELLSFVVALASFEGLDSDNADTAPYLTEHGPNIPQHPRFWMQHPNGRRGHLICIKPVAKWCRESRRRANELPARRTAIDLCACIPG